MHEVSCCVVVDGGGAEEEHSTHSNSSELPGKKYTQKRALVKIFDPLMTELQIRRFFAYKNSSNLPHLIIRLQQLLCSVYIAKVLQHTTTPPPPPPESQNKKLPSFQKPGVSLRKRNGCRVCSGSR